MAHISLEDVKDQLEADMDMGIGHAARRNGSNISGEAGRSDVLADMPCL